MIASSRAGAEIVPSNTIRFPRIITAGQRDLGKKGVRTNYSSSDFPMPSGSRRSRDFDPLTPSSVSVALGGPKEEGTRHWALGIGNLCLSVANASSDQPSAINLRPLASSLMALGSSLPPSSIRVHLWLLLHRHPDLRKASGPACRKKGTLRVTR